MLLYAFKDEDDDDADEKNSRAILKKQQTAPYLSIPTPSWLSFLSLVKNITFPKLNVDTFATDLNALFEYRNEMSTTEARTLKRRRSDAAIRAAS